MKILRIDDFFSNTRLFNQHAKTKRISIFLLKKIPILFFANWFFFKRIKIVKGWAPFPEITTNQLLMISDLLEKFNCSATLAITATFADEKGKLIPFFEKYPEHSKIIKDGIHKKIFHIANHGLTHCVLNKKKYLPHIFSSNRKYHREFWSWIPYDIKKKHITKSNKLLEEYFNIKIDTFVPPGNVWCKETEEIITKEGINILITDKKNIDVNKNKIKIINNNIIAIHTKDIVEGPKDYFINLLRENDYKLQSVFEYNKIKNINS